MVQGLLHGCGGLGFGLRNPLSDKVVIGMEISHIGIKEAIIVHNHGGDGGGAYLGLSFEKRRVCVLFYITPRWLSQQLLFPLKGSSKFCVQHKQGHNGFYVNSNLFVSPDVVG